MRILAQKRLVLIQGGNFHSKKSHFDPGVGIFTEICLISLCVYGMYAITSTVFFQPAAGYSRLTAGRL
jgi:hypothetical protein